VLCAYSLLATKSEPRDAGIGSDGITCEIVFSLRLGKNPEGGFKLRRLSQAGEKGCGFAVCGEVESRLFRGGFSTGFGFGEPASAETFLGNAGKVGFDVEDGSAIEHVHAAHVQARAVAAEKFYRGQADGIGAAGGAGGEDAVGTVVAGWAGDEVVALGAVEDPEDDQVGKTFDVGEAWGEFRQDFEGALGLMLCAEAFGDVAGVGVGSEGASDGLGSEHGVIFAWGSVVPRFWLLLASSF